MIKKEVKNKITKNEDKILYSCKTEIGVEEFKKMVKYMPRIYWTYVGISAVVAFFFVLYVGHDTKLSYLIPGYFGVIIILMIYYRIKLGDIVKINYDSLAKNNKMDTNLDINFYDNYLTVSVPRGVTTIKYSDLKKIIETDTNFYFKAKNKKLIVIQKANCDSKLVEFIQKIDIQKK